MYKLPGWIISVYAPISEISIDTDPIDLDHAIDHGWTVVEQCRSYCRGSACGATLIWALFCRNKGLVRGGIFSSLFVAVDKKGLAHVLVSNYEGMRTLVCETLLNREITNLTPQIKDLPPPLLGYGRQFIIRINRNWRRNLLQQW